MRRSPLVAIGVLIALSTSCSLAFQDSVRSSGTQCSTSRVWYVGDFLVAGAFAALVANVDGPAESYIPAGVLIGSGLIGIYKRRHCVRYREAATPEMWAQDAERAQRQDEARAQAMRAMAAQMSQPDAPPPSGTYQPAPAATSSSGGYTSSSGGGVNVSVERHDAADEVGKSCSSPNDTDRELPTAGTCQYGAVCYQGRCTTWCGNGGSCPSGLTCGWTDGHTRMQVCR